MAVPLGVGVRVPPRVYIIMFTFYLSQLKPDYCFDTMVDLGCGSGNMSERLLKKINTRHLIGIDCIKKPLERFEKTFEEADFKVQTIRCGAGGYLLGKIPEGTVDLICSKAMFWVCGKETTKSVLKNTAKLLTPNGTVLFVNSFIRRSFFKAQTSSVFSHEERAWTLEELERVIIESGLVEKAKKVYIYASDHRCYEIVAGNSDCFEKLPQSGLISTLTF